LGVMGVGAEEPPYDECADDGERRSLAVAVARPLYGSAVELVACME
jgi:hypothetical protein